ncbi:TPA: hypothetical protein PMB01_001656 [Vibrio cholerae]|nr:hypothetical protein [Vibrio cholerae]
MTELMLKATVANGVEVVELCDYPEVEQLEFRDFVSELSSLDHDEEIFTRVMPAGTDGLYEELDAEYGIN